MRDAMSEPKKPGQAWSDARRAVLYGGTCQEKCWLQFSACRVAPVCVAIELNLNPHPLHTPETQRMGHPAGNNSKPAASKPKAALPGSIPLSINGITSDVALTVSRNSL